MRRPPTLWTVHRLPPWRRLSSAVSHSCRSAATASAHPGTPAETLAITRLSKCGDPATGDRHTSIRDRLGSPKPLMIMEGRVTGEWPRSAQRLVHRDEELAQ